MPTNPARREEAAIAFLEAIATSEVGIVAVGIERRAVLGDMCGSQGTTI